MARKRLGEILLDAGVIDQSRLRAALVEQRRWGGHLGRILIDMKLISEEVLVQALSQQLNFPAINLDSRSITPEVLDLVPADLAEQNSLVPFNVDGKFLDVAMTDPTNLGIVDELRIRTQLNVRPYLAGPKMIERALYKHYGRGAGMLGTSTNEGGSGLGGVAMLELDSDRSAAAKQQRADPMTAAQRRAQAVALSAGHEQVGGAEIANLQERLANLEALVQRDEDVIRKLMGLLVEKGVATRDEILARIR